jgi:hypothetical protein
MERKEAYFLILIGIFLGYHGMALFLLFFPRVLLLASFLDSLAASPNSFDLALNRSLGVWHLSLLGNPTCLVPKFWSEGSGN